jgi:hypothetical protein
MSTRFRSPPISSPPTAIDSQEHIVYGVSIASAGEATGHRLVFDLRTLQQLAELGNAAPHGVKCRFTHPGLVADGLGKFLGRMRNFRLAHQPGVDPAASAAARAQETPGGRRLKPAESERSDRGSRLAKVLADLHLAEVAAHSPAGDLRLYIEQLALQDPAAFGVSVVVDLDRVWVLQDGSELPAGTGPRTPPENATTEFPVARLAALYAADAVDEPALNPDGLFTVIPTKGESQTRPTYDPEEIPIMSTEITITQTALEAAGKSAGMADGKAAGKAAGMAAGAQPEPEPGPVLDDRLAALQAQVDALHQMLQRSLDHSAIRMSGTPPRQPNITVNHPVDQFQNAWDWVFGARGAKLPPPELRRTDALYRLITGDLEWRGSFDPAHAQFAAATTTTLADLAANAMNKVILETYDSLVAYRWYEQIVAVQANDGSLQDMAWIEFGGIANLPVVAEGAAYTELTVGDTKESDSFTKYGGYVGITDKMIRNSEIARMQAIPRALTVAAVRTRSAAIAGIFTSNSGVGPTLDQDSTALFDAGHSNLATTAYSWTAWKAARLECAKQSELTSSKRMMLWPKFWLGPADLYDQALIDFGYGAGPGGRPGEGSTTAFQDVNPYAQDRPGDPRPIPIAVPEFTDTGDWAYLVDPRLHPVICMSYGIGGGGLGHPAPELYVATSPLAGLMFTNDTLPIKVRDYFAYGVATYRGIGKRNVS